MNYHIPFPEQLPAMQDRSLTYSGLSKEAAVRHFEVNTLQCLIADNQLENDTWNKAKSYEFFWIKTGSGTLEIDLDEYEIKERMIFFLSKDTRHLLKLNAATEGYYISFSADFFYHTDVQSERSVFQLLYQGSSHPWFIDMNNEMAEDMELVVLKMIKEFTHYNQMRSEILQGLFIVFMMYISRISSDEKIPVTNNKDIDLVRNFTVLLKRDLTTKKQVSDYAGELCVTPAYLNQVVKKISGFTASHHIQQCIILEAKRQAIYSNASMKEIAYLLGFTDLFHFSKFFKKNSGMNFTSFRKEVCKMI